MVLSMGSRAASFLAVAASTLLLSFSAEAAHAALLTGRVLDARNGEPLPDARVRLASPPAETATDRAGGFRFDNLAPGAYEVQASRVGYGPDRRLVTVAVDSASVEFRLAPRPIPVSPV